ALDAHHIGVETEAPGDIAVDVGVGVDHAGQHQLAARVDHLLGGRRNDALADLRNLAARDGDVHHAVDAGGRADHVSALQEDVVSGGCVHDLLPSECERTNVFPRFAGL